MLILHPSFNREGKENKKEKKRYSLWLAVLELQIEREKNEEGGKSLNKLSRQLEDKAHMSQK